eukprot:scaffold17343_cov93-Skeletonema_dohrnii-CCMP3373.AAC.3
MSSEFEFEGTKSQPYYVKALASKKLGLTLRTSPMTVLSHDISCVINRKMGRELLSFPVQPTSSTDIFHHHT